MELETTTTTTSTPEPAAPAAPPQVVALETAGVTDLAREQGAQGVTLEQLRATVDNQAGELGTLRAELAQLRERQQTAAIVEAIEPEPEPEPEETATVIDVQPLAESEVTTSDETPRRERGLLARMFLGRSI